MKRIYCSLLYLLISIYTFGHCYAKHGTREDRQFASATEINVTSSLFAAMFWPLYWSVHFQSSRP